MPKTTISEATAFWGARSGQSTWRFMGRVISRVTILITHIRGFLSPLITTLKP